MGTRSPSGSSWSTGCSVSSGEQRKTPPTTTAVPPSSTCDTSCGTRLTCCGTRGGCSGETPGRSAATDTITAGGSTRGAQGPATSQPAGTAPGASTPRVSATKCLPLTSATTRAGAALRTSQVSVVDFSVYSHWAVAKATSPQKNCQNNWCESHFQSEIIFLSHSVLVNVIGFRYTENVLPREKTLKTKYINARSHSSRLRHLVKRDPVLSLNLGAGLVGKESYSKD